MRAGSCASPSSVTKSRSSIARSTIAALLLCDHRRAEPVGEDALAGLSLGRDQKILDERHLRERARDLEGAAEAVAKPRVRRLAARCAAPSSRIRAGRRLHRAGDEIEERRLAGAVRADQPDDLAAADRHRHPVDGRDAAEVPRDRADLEHGNQNGLGLGDARPSGRLAADANIVTIWCLEPCHAMSLESHMKNRPSDSFELYDLKVEVTAPAGATIYCGAKPGDYFEVKGEMLYLPPGQGFSIYSLAALLPLLPAKQRADRPERLDVDRRRGRLPRSELPDAFPDHADGQTAVQPFRR